MSLRVGLVFLGSLALPALLALPGVALAQTPEPLPPEESTRQRQALADQRAAIDLAFASEKTNVRNALPSLPASRMPPKSGATRWRRCDSKNWP